MSETTSKPPIWFWVIAVILALWGLMGLYVYYDFVTSTPESMAKYVEAGTYTRAYADSLLETPAWSTAVFALAVCSGALGALSLILRKSWSVPLYMASLLFVIISLGNMFLLDKVHKLMSGGQIGMEGVVFCLGVLAVWVSRKAKKENWLK